MKQLLIAFFLLSGLALGQNITDATKQLKNLPQAVQAQVSTHNLSVPANCIAHSGSATAYTCATTPTFTPAVGDHIQFEADVANTGTATLAVNGAAAATIHKQGGSVVIVANDLLAGHWISATFDGTYWQLEGQLGNASTTPSDIVKNDTSNTYTASTIQDFSGTTEVKVPTPTNSADAANVGYVNSVIPNLGNVTSYTGSGTKYASEIGCYNQTFNIPTITSGVVSPTLTTALFSVPAYWHAVGFVISESTLITTSNGQITALSAQLQGNSGVVFTYPSMLLMGATSAGYISYEGGFYSSASTESGSQTISLVLSVANLNPGNLGTSSTSSFTAGAVTVKACGVTIQ